MKLAIALTLFASKLFGAEAVFTDFSPAKVKQMTIGPMRCVLWAAAPPWGPEAACWQGATVVHIQVSMPGSSMVGNAEFPEGKVTWLVTDAGKWQMTAQPTGGVAIYREGTF